MERGRGRLYEVFWLRELSNKNHLTLNCLEMFSNITAQWQIFLEMLGNILRNLPVPYLQMST